MHSELTCSSLACVTRSSCLQVAHLAETFNIKVAPHFLMEIHVSLCCAVPNSLILEYIPQLDTITKSRIRIEGGFAYPSDAVGHGIEWDFEAIARLAVSTAVFTA